MDAFKVHGDVTGSDFSNKVKDVFSNIDVMADRYLSNRATYQDNIVHEKEETLFKSDPTDDETSTLETTLFKRPCKPAKKVGRTQMGHTRRNPAKWTEYDLSDVRPGDLSDRANTAAALSFLTELKKRKLQVEPTDHACEKVRFRCPSTKDKGQSDTNATVTSVAEKHSSYVGTKLVMPNYEVGVNTKPAKVRKQSYHQTMNSCINAGGKVGLDHLDNSTIADTEPAEEGIKRRDEASFKAPSKSKKSYRIKGKHGNEDE